MNKWLHRRSGWAVATLLVIAALVVAGNLQSAAAPLPQADPPFETMSLPAEALSWSVDPLVDVRAASSPKLDSSLVGLAAAVEESTQAALAWAEAQGLRLSGDQIHVQVVTDAAALPGAIAAMTKAGGAVTKVANDATLIQGWLPVNALEAMAASEDVYLIRRPAELVLLENVEGGNSTTEGLAAINGPAWHSAGHQGAGVKIGIIDSGFLGYPSLLGVDLPAAVTVKNFVDGETDAQVNGTTKHGTACAEVIHDIAPAATLFLAKISTNLDLQEAVTWLKNTHQVDIISTSIGWYHLTPGDGTGEFANLVQTARDAGILWATAAGNARETHWGGLYYDPNNTGYHHYSATQNVNYFGPGDGNAYSIPAGYRVTVFLRWNDWSAVNQDYDLYLLRWSGSAWTTIASGVNYQNGGAGQTPTEYVTAVTSGGATAYGFGIRRYNSNRAVNFEVFAPDPGPRLDKILHARSLANLADAPRALTVAALDVAAPYPQEPYSSQGPTNGPGGAETGGFVKPDLSGFANVSTESYGVVNKFNGTSAAVPHVAGAAALVKGAYPAYTPAQVQSFLEGRAVDMGVAGKDNIYGHGRLYLGAPPATSATPTPTATPTRTPTITTTPAVTPTGDPGGVLKRYLPITLRHGPAVTPTATPTPTRTAEPTHTPTSTATTQPGGWSIVTIPGQNQGIASSIAVDNGGNPHISFSDDTTRSVRYAFRSGSGWDVQVIDTRTVEWVYASGSLAVSGNGKPHIAYDWASPCHLRHAEWDGSQWQRNHFSMPCPYFVDVALKADDEPCISFRYNLLGDPPDYRMYKEIRVLCRSAGNWATASSSRVTSVENVPGLLQMARFHSLALDRQDRVHISFTRGVYSHELRYRSPSSVSWGEVVDAAPNVGFFSSLALDSQDRPHISYYDYTNRDLKYARWSANQWVIERIDSPGDVGRYTSIALDAGGNPHISYYDATNRDLKYAFWDGSRWQIRTVDSQGNVGEWTSLALDSAGNAHISYYDHSNGTLKYATNVGAFSQQAQ